MGGILGSSGTNAKQSRAVGSLQFQTSQRGGVIPLMYGNNRLAPNLLDYDDFKATASSASGGKGGKGGGGGKGGSQQYMYSASFILGLCQGPIENIGTAWADKNVGVTETAPASYINVLFGTDGQAVDSFWETNHPAKAISYSATAAVVLGIYQLGNMATLPNFSFEIISAFTDGPNGADANPASIVTDFLTNLRYGANFPSANLDTLALWRSYCQALGIALSPKIDTLLAANTYLDSIVKLTNSAIVVGQSSEDPPIRGYAGHECVHDRQFHRRTDASRRRHHRADRHRPGIEREYARNGDVHDVGQSADVGRHGGAGGGNKCPLRADEFWHSRRKRFGLFDDDCPGQSHGQHVVCRHGRRRDRYRALRRSHDLHLHAGYATDLQPQRKRLHRSGVERRELYGPEPWRRFAARGR